ncbi:MAG TPA: alpha/beta hydrolase-fold protein [Gemmatimonadaceae bacterium]
MRRRCTSSALLVLLVALACRAGPPPTYLPRDASLRRRDLLFYVPPRAEGSPRALVVFLGNDVGFWEPHQQLASRLAASGYAVVGLDIRQYLAGLPDGEPQRDRVFADSIVPLVAAIRRELGDSLPLVLGGHSFGAEVALWIARNHEPPGLRGVLAMSPRSSGHLFVTAGDLANDEAHGVGAWSTIEAVRDMDPRVRVAIVRGANDQFAVHDSAFMAAGSTRLRRFPVPLAGHSLKKLLIAGPIVEHAVGYLLEPR